MQILSPGEQSKDSFELCAVLSDSEWGAAWRGCSVCGFNQELVCVTLHCSEGFPEGEGFLIRLSHQANSMAEESVTISGSQLMNNPFFPIFLSK